jgi:hypothetical protein
MRRGGKAGTARQGGTSKTVWITTNAKPCKADGLDPDNPAVIAAIDLVRWELSLGDLVTAPARRESFSLQLVVGTKVITRRLPVSWPLCVAPGQTGRATSDVPLSRAASSNREVG